MKCLLIGAAGLALLLTGCPELAATNGKACVSKKYSPAEIFQKTAPSIVVIAVGESLGSGFVIKQDKRYTYILTNSHVVSGADEVKVKWADDREETGKVISDHGGKTWQKDLALVRVDAVRGIPLKFKEKPPAVGEDVVVIGAPQGLEFSLSRGVMSQLRNNGDFLQVDAPVNPGNSGGPLFDKTGCVVGVVTFKDEDSEGINFAIGYGPTKHFLDNPAIERPEPKPEPIASEPADDESSPNTAQGWYTYNKTEYYISQILMESVRRTDDIALFRYREVNVRTNEESGAVRSIDCRLQILQVNDDYAWSRSSPGKWGIHDNWKLTQEWMSDPNFPDFEQEWEAIYQTICVNTSV